MQNDDSVVTGKPSEPFYDTYDGHHEGMENTDDRMKIKANVHSQGESLVVIDEDRMETRQIEISAGPQTEGTVSADKYLESSNNISCGSIPQPTVGMSQDLDMGVSQKMDCIQEKEDNADLSAHDKSVHTSGSSVQLEETPDMHGSNLDKSELSLSTDTATSGKNISNILGTEDELTLNATMSSQIRITDVIEEVIADARNNKVLLYHILIFQKHVSQLCSRNLI